MMGTYKKGAINIAASFPIYLLILINFIINKFYLLDVVGLSIVYLIFMVIMYKLYINKREMVYNVGQFLALFMNFVSIYYVCSTGVLNYLFNILH